MLRTHVLFFVVSVGVFLRPGNLFPKADSRARAKWPKPKLKMAADNAVAAARQAAADKRPVCADWGTHKGCKKARGCKFAHATASSGSSAAAHADRLPWLSPYQETGADEVKYDMVTLRPPLKEALEAHLALEPSGSFFY